MGYRRCQMCEKSVKSQRLEGHRGFYLHEERFLDGHPEPGKVFEDLPGSRFDVKRCERNIYEIYMYIKKTFYIILERVPGAEIA